MRILIRPSEFPQLPVDVTNSMVAAVARELSRIQVGDDEKNWREAELLVQQMVGKTLVGPVDCEDRRSLRMSSEPSWST